jgi:peptide/nickel transport system substrate-binding protein
VRFHDGSTLDAEDVAYTFRSFLDPAFLSPRKGAYAQLAAVEIETPRTVVFRLKEPFASFPVNLVMGIVPAGTPPGAPARIGAGPYRFVGMQADDRVELAPFAEYFEGAPRNGGVVLRVIPDDTMRGLELRTGAIDMVVNDIAPDIVGALQREGDVQVVTAPGLDYAYVGMNLRDPVLRDARVRRALGYGVNTAAIIEHLRRGLAVPTTGIIPSMSWAHAADLQPVPYDPAAARRLLDEAGHRDPDGDGPAPRLRLTLKTSTAEFSRLQAAVVQQDLAKIGVAVEVRTHEFATLYADVLKGNFQLFTLQWVGVTDPDMLRRVFHSAQMPPAGFNRGFFSDPAVDALIDEATSQQDAARRRAQYADVQRRVYAAAPYVSLWTKVNVAVAQPWVRGVHLTPQASFAMLRLVTKQRR